MICGLKWRICEQIQFFEFTQIYFILIRFKNLNKIILMIKVNILFKKLVVTKTIKNNY